MNCGVIGGNRRHLSPAQGIPADSRGRILSPRFLQQAGPQFVLDVPFCCLAVVLVTRSSFLPTCAPYCILIFTWLIIRFFWFVPAGCVLCTLYPSLVKDSTNHQGPRCNLKQQGLFFCVDDCVFITSFMALSSCSCERCFS